MKFAQTELAGAFVVDLEPIEDERGFFARSFCVEEFTRHGLDPLVQQCNVSFNRLKGTLRGMHSHVHPFEEAKLVRCTRGGIFDVIIDMRPGSATYKRHVGVELTAENRRALFVPEGFFHGFLTLDDNTEVFYQMSRVFVPGKAIGIRWNDPAFGIVWPGEVRAISEKDRSYPDFSG